MSTLPLSQLGNSSANSSAVSSIANPQRAAKMDENKRKIDQKEVATLLLK
jgi:hypothetical protein